MARLEGARLPFLGDLVSIEPEEQDATPEGIRVVDVWETREQFERFAQEQIGPSTREVGIEGEPQMRFHDVHNHIKAG